MFIIEINRPYGEGTAKIKPDMVEYYLDKGATLTENGKLEYEIYLESQKPKQEVVKEETKTKK